MSEMRQMDGVAANIICRRDDTMTRRKVLIAFIGGLVGGVVSLFSRTTKAHELYRYDVVGTPYDNLHSTYRGKCGFVELSLDNSNKGKLISCYVEGNDDSDEYMFECRDDGTIVANLEGYAIIPIKKWCKLTGRKFEC